MDFGSFARQTQLDALDDRRFHCSPVKRLSHRLVQAIRTSVPEIVVVPIQEVVTQGVWDNDATLKCDKRASEESKNLVIWVVLAGEAHRPNLLDRFIALLVLEDDWAVHDTWWIVRRGVNLVVHLRLLYCVKSHSGKGVRAEVLYALDVVQRQNVFGKKQL